MASRTPENQKSGTPNQTSKRTGIYKNFLTGGISASIARTLTNPIERLEILRQVENVDYKGMSLGRAMVKFYKTQGVTGLFKGNSASIARIFPFSAVEFYSFEMYKNIFIYGRPERNNSVLYTMLCGTLTGLNAITATFPLDVARTRLAVRTETHDNSGLSKIITQLYKEGGLRALYKGYSVTFIGSIPFVAIKQTSFDLLKNHFTLNIDNPRKKQFMYFIFGAVSGVFGTVILYPTYMLKRVLQANDNKSFQLSHYIKDLYIRSGFTGFFKGMSMTLIKVIPYQGILFSCNEKLKVLFKYEK
jgi:hypothetical protein